MSNIEEIINELTQPDGKVVMLCGAGISINSGLPAATPLVNEILTCLDIDADDKNKLLLPDGSMAMPFEIFIETFLENTNTQELLDIFKEGKPCSNHYFIAKCYEHLILNEIYTTNFDQLIEQAFTLTGKKISVFHSEESFANIDTSALLSRLIKVHGSIENTDSIRATLSTITKRTLSREREKVIDRLFGSTDDKKKVLILGYSCSDIFDIIPCIEKVYNPKAEIYLIDHDGSLDKKDDALIESIQSRKDNNPFKKYKGKRIRVSTDSFIQWLWEKIDVDYERISDRNDNWKSHVLRWRKSFHAKYLEFSMIGQLFYRISDFDLSLKYHQKALLNCDDGYKRGEGASYSNIGLIYHDLKEYPEAISNFEKAASIYPEDFYFGHAAAHTNLGYSYIYVPDRIKALIHFKKSLLISRGHDFRENRRCEADALSNLGLLYEKNEEYSNALYYYSLTLDIDKEGNISGEAQTLSDMGRVNKLTGNLKQALQLFDHSNRIAKKMGMQSLIIYTHQQAEEIRVMLQ